MKEQQQRVSVYCIKDRTLVKATTSQDAVDFASKVEPQKRLLPLEFDNPSQLDHIRKPGEPIVLFDLLLIKLVGSEQYYSKKQ